MEILREFDPTPGVTISTLEYEYPAAWEVAQHAHGADQLIYAVRGVMEVSSGYTLWVVPPQFAMWVPAGIRTQHPDGEGGFNADAVCAGGPGAKREESALCCTCRLLLRELTLEAVRSKSWHTRVRVERGLSDVIASQLEQAEFGPNLDTGCRNERRTAAVCRAVLREPGRRATLGSSMRRCVCECANRPTRSSRRDGN